MAVSLLPTGKANWTNYVDYWREEDAEWIQDRLVLRVADDAQRDSPALALTRGSLVFNELSGGMRPMLELCLDPETHDFMMINPHPDSIVALEEPGKTTVSHIDAGGKGIVHGITEIGITNKLDVMAGTLVVEGGSAGYVGIKSGSNDQARLTTVGTGAATTLASNVPLSVPSLTLSGTGTVLSAPGKSIAVGTVSAATGTFSGNVTVAGTLFVTGTAGDSTIRGTNFKSGYVEAGGYQTSWGFYGGDSSSAIMRWRNPTTLATGTAYLQTHSNDHVYAGGIGFFMNPTLYIRGGKAINYYDAPGNFRGYISPSLYSPTDPGSSYYPDGTIWIS